MPIVQNIFAFLSLNSLVNIEMAEYNQKPKNKTNTAIVMLLIISSFI